MRTQTVEQNTIRIFEKIDTFGTALAAHQVDVAKQIGGIRIWVLGGVLAVAVSLLIYFAKDYAHDIERGVGKQPAAVTAPK